MSSLSSRRVRGMAVVLLLAGGCVSAGCGTADPIFLWPTRSIDSVPSDFGYTYSDLSLTTSAGVRLSAWRVASVGQHKGLLVVIYGSGANKGLFTPMVKLFADNGWDVILYDHEGYGQSDGTASFAGVMRSARAVLDYAVQQDPVVVGVGYSLGAAVLVRMAADYNLTACVFDGTPDLRREPSLLLEHFNIGSPFDSVIDAVWAPAIPKDYDTRFWITKVTEPKLFIHSPSDTLAPFPGAWEIYLAAPSPKNFILTEGEHSLDIAFDPTLYQLVVNGWLDAVLDPDAALSAEFQAYLEQQVQSFLAEYGFRSAGS